MKSSQVASGRAEVVSSRHGLTNLAKRFYSNEVFVISTVPRGGLQLVQMQKSSESDFKQYTRFFQIQDTLSWTAIQKHKAVRAAGAYLSEFVKKMGYAHAAAAPVNHVIFRGYPGVVQFFRTADQGEFTDGELIEMGHAVQELERAPKLLKGNHTGINGSDKGPTIWQWSFDSHGKLRGFEESFHQLDERLRNQLVQQVLHRVQRLDAKVPVNPGEPVSTDRVVLPDSDGDHRAFNIAVYPKYPALGNGPTIFVCMMPGFTEWSAVKSADFGADEELSRLIPSLKFMQQEYHRGPTLTEISRQVHLSPFHFHRRFSQLLGLTPKHFLLECQIYDAKSELLAGDKPLAKIAADCGFAHQSHFTSRFKQTTGLTPTRWRRMALARRNG